MNEWKKNNNYYLLVPLRIGFKKFNSMWGGAVLVRSLSPIYVPQDRYTCKITTETLTNNMNVLMTTPMDNNQPRKTPIFAFIKKRQLMIWKCSRRPWQTLLKLPHDAAGKKNQNWLSPYFSPSFFSGSHVIITKRRPYLYNTYFLSNRGKKVRNPTMA